MAQKIIQEAKKLLKGPQSKIYLQFFDTFCEPIPDVDIKEMNSKELALTAQKHWDLTKDRKEGKHAVNVFTTEEGNEARTIIDIVCKDMTFLIDSVTAVIANHQKLIMTLLSPTFYVKRSKNGQIIDVSTAPLSGAELVTHLHIKLDGTVSKNFAKELKKELLGVLEDVHFATRDWLVMRERLKDCQKILRDTAPGKYKKPDIDEYVHFLEYMYKDNFTLLGYREYAFTKTKNKITSRIVKGKGLGLLNDDRHSVFISDDSQGLSDKLQAMRCKMAPLHISKVNRKSTVHRSVPLDSVAIKQYNKKGDVVKEYLFIGLFTSVTYSRSIQDVPLLRKKADEVLLKSKFEQGNHEYKALRHILEKYPRDELFEISVDDLLQTSISIVRLQERKRIALYTRMDPFQRYISCLVYVPRDRFDTRLRLRFQEILEEMLQGECNSFYTNLDDSQLARVIFSINIDQKNPPEYNVEDIEKKLQAAGRLWGERLTQALKTEGRHTEAQIVEIVDNYSHAFPPGYQKNYLPKQAVFDIEKIETALECGYFSLDLYKPSDCGSHDLRLKIFQAGKPVTLSDVLPVLENMGLRVIAELPFEIKPAHSDVPIWIHDFRMEVNADKRIFDVQDIKDIFEEALFRIWYGESDSDSLNELILNAAMNWREIMVLRTYVHYMRQMRYHYGSRYIEQALTKNPVIARKIIELFNARLDPEQYDGTDKRESLCVYAIEQALNEVSVLDEDIILRSIVNLIQATLRTNFFQIDENTGKPKTYLSIKMNSREVKGLPKPHPYREIYVYSPRVEGIHLRGDVIARGGLRWSDRAADYRTEILGLMKAQQVKNSVIVPMGAKGGFVLRKPPSRKDRKAFLEEGIECYKIFIRGLLDITDNRKGRQVVPPKNDVRQDDDDPYLVVAADKGTATFSDIANGLSAEYDFWLGDAFASGGSAGYDHKKMGITARGGWESVKRHFRELNHDIQSKPFDVVGVGDMGGDVFGNGMLLSEHIRLIAAFNHMHIFCDPDPDTAASLKERQRLFKEVKGWDHYDTKLLSPGGRIYSRSDKSLLLTPEIQKRFGIEEDKVTPFELMRYILKTRADLLWFGGIGTYVKATHEQNTDVGDKANDNIRINAKELRVNVVGEGANLGVTQAGRVEFAKKGGHINADFIDNSGGVDSSDHEVNIKILLHEVCRDKSLKMSLKARNKLLEEMTNTVAGLVLNNNYQQGQGLSLMEHKAAENLASYASYIKELERTENLDRVLEGLPDKEEISNRMNAGKGLTRPEISVVQCYAKIALTKALLKSNLPDAASLQQDWLVNYFPEQLREKYVKHIKSHRLRREIVSTRLSNHIVNRMGPTFVRDMMDKTGAPCEDVVRAWIIVLTIFDIPTFWKQVEDQDLKVPCNVQIEAFEQLSRMVSRETLWFLTRLGRRPYIKRDVADYKDGVAVLKSDLDYLVTDKMKEQIKLRTQMGIDNGLPKDLAHKIALIPTLGAACDVIRTSQICKTDIKTTGRVYFELSEHFHIGWLRKQARYIVANDQWTADARDSLIEQLYSSQAGLTAHILRDLKKDSHFKDVNVGKGNSPLQVWLDEYGDLAEQIQPVFETLRRGGSIDMAMLIIAEQKLRTLYGG